MELKRLNWVRLQDALYAAWKRYDTPETKEAGRREIREIYDEYARRGFTNVALPEPLRQ